MIVSIAYVIMYIIVLVEAICKGDGKLFSMLLSYKMFALLLLAGGIIGICSRLNDILKEIGGNRNGKGV